MTEEKSSTGRTYFSISKYHPSGKIMPCKFTLYFKALNACLYGISVYWQIIETTRRATRKFGFSTIPLTKVTKRYKGNLRLPVSFKGMHKTKVTGNLVGARRKELKRVTLPLRKSVMMNQRNKNAPDPAPVLTPNSTPATRDRRARAAMEVQVALLATVIQKWGRFARKNQFQVLCLATHTPLLKAHIRRRFGVVDLNQIILHW